MANKTIGEWLDSLDTPKEQLEFLEKVIADHTTESILGLQTTMGAGCLDMIGEERIYPDRSFSEYLRRRWGVLDPVGGLTSEDVRRG